MKRRTFLQTLSCASALPFTAEAESASGFFRSVPPGESGISWVHDNAGSQGFHMPELMGAGCAFLDYDNDGWMDIYLVNSGPCDFWTPPKPIRNALYHNNRDGTFTDVTAKAGVPGVHFGIGVAVGDYDGDGWPDILVTGYPHCVLYKNNRDGTFTDVTQKAGIITNGWSSSAAWFDYDNDGRLDLFIASYIEYGAHGNEICRESLGRYGYCSPRPYKGRASYLFHNNGDGTFTEVGHTGVIGKTLGKALGVVATDINNDGWMDLFVANDTVPNFLFANRGKGQWEEIGLSGGVAYSDNGNPRAGMGVDSADYDNDGKMDLFLANVDHERYSLYHNEGDEVFADAALSTPIGMATEMMAGWGLKFFDYDNDGNLDLILANGHPDPVIDQHTANVHYLEPLLLFHHSGKAFDNVSAQAGSAFQLKLAARGLAVGDYDNDGGVDVLVLNNGGAPLLLHNEIGAKANWVGLKLVGVKANIDAVGAVVRWSAGGVIRSRMKIGGGSYASAHDPRIVLGLGSAQKLDWLEVKWPMPSGRVERFADVPLGKYSVLTEGKGVVQNAGA